MLQLSTDRTFHFELLRVLGTARSYGFPTLLLGNGYDGSQEEMLHAFGFAALERGFNVVTFEGPGSF